MKGLNKWTKIIFDKLTKFKKNEKYFVKMDEIAKILTSDSSLLVILADTCSHETVGNLDVWMESPVER